LISRVYWRKPVVVPWGGKARRELSVADFEDAETEEGIALGEEISD